MAKSKNHSSHSNGHRDTSVIASRRLVVLPVPRLSPLILPELEDRRTYNPTRSVAPPRALRKDHARLTLPVRRAKKHQTKTAVSFAVPQKVALCARREIRREVLHAKRVAGKSGLKKPRRNFWSSISCKR